MRYIKKFNEEREQFVFDIDSGEFYSAMRNHKLWGSFNKEELLLTKYYFRELHEYFKSENAYIQFDLEDIKDESGQQWMPGIVMIIKNSDEWFFIRVERKNYEEYYKCDSIIGLKEFLIEFRIENAI